MILISSHRVVRALQWSCHAIVCQVALPHSRPFAIVVRLAGRRPRPCIHREFHKPCSATLHVELALIRWSSSQEHLHARKRMYQQVPVCLRCASGSWVLLHFTSCRFHPGCAVILVCGLLMFLGVFPFSGHPLWCGACLNPSFSARLVPYVEKKRTKLMQRGTHRRTSGRCDHRSLEASQWNGNRLGQASLGTVSAPGLALCCLDSMKIWQILDKSAVLWVLYTLWYFLIVYRIHQEPVMKRSIFKDLSLTL